MYKCIKAGVVGIGKAEAEMCIGDDVDEIIDGLDKGVVKSLVDNGYIVDATKELAEAKKAKAGEKAKLDAAKKKAAAAKKEAAEAKKKGGK